MSNKFSGNTGQIFTKFSGLVEILKGLTNPVLILQLLKGRCHGNELVAKLAFLLTNLHCCTAITRWIGTSERQWAAQQYIRCV